MNFLLIGNGAREHAIALAVCKNDKMRLFAFMNSKNPGIAKLCKQSGGEFAIGDIENCDDITAWIKDKNIDLAFASPDAVIGAGVSDALIVMGIKVASPTKRASRLEWDKKYLRDLMSENLIDGCPKYRYFERTAGVDEYIEELGEVAIKPVGLTGGKGVKVVGHQLADLDEAKKYVRDVLVNGIGGGAVVIEQKLEGEEFTLMAFCDGETLVFMPTVQDHKRTKDGDIGENTGGMGAYCDNSKLLPFLKNAEYEKACEIMRNIIKAQAKRERFVGVLYGQFMTTAHGIYVIETNARFGDPEAMNVLSILKSDLYDIFNSMAQKTLFNMQIDWEQKATVVKYLVPNGYPKKSVEPAPITIDYDALESCGAQIFFASVNEKEDGKIYSQKSRSIAILAKADTIERAGEITEIGAQAISGPLWHRKDIGTKELLDKRIAHMKSLRGE